MSANRPNPDMDWYLRLSRERGVTPRCPFASLERCPRYYQSLSLLGEAGSTKIDEDEDQRLRTLWESSDLWPRTAEAATYVSGPKDRRSQFGNFCPEVAYERFHFFASYLGDYADEIDRGLAHESLARDGTSAGNWRWRWAGLTPSHFTECPLYSPLTQDTGLQRQTTSSKYRLAAIFVADVVGYSRLVELDETGTLERLKTIRAEVVDPKIAEGHGRIFHTAGDSILAEFRSALDALRCASGIQAAMAERGAVTAPHSRIEFRIGINQGDVVAEGNDLLGDCVNIAARLEDLAHPGGICVSSRVQEDTAGKLEVSSEDIGEPTLKNIARPIRVYRVHPGRTPREPSASVTDLIALGPDVVCVGEITGFAGLEWKLRLQRFVIGDVGTLLAFAERFEGTVPSERYVIVNALGDGRKLAEAPSVTRNETGYIVECRVLPRFPRINAHDLPPMAALSPGGDLFVRGGQIARVSGLEALPLIIRTCLSLQKGESPFHRDYGARLAEYYHAFRRSRWFEALLKLEVIRQAAIPYYDSVQNREYIPLRCIERVSGIKLLAEAPENHQLPVRFDMDIAGVGRTQLDVPIFIPENSQNGQPPSTAN